jgi:hypothetical protein
MLLLNNRTLKGCCSIKASANSVKSNHFTTISYIILLLLAIAHYCIEYCGNKLNRALGWLSPVKNLPDNTPKPLENTLTNLRSHEHKSQKKHSQTSDLKANTDFEWFYSR